jgi:hypothetical protein
MSQWDHSDRSGDRTNEHRSEAPTDRGPLGVDADRPPRAVLALRSFGKTTTGRKQGFRPVWLKRVIGFEPTTFTLATCEDTGPEASGGPILPRDPGGVTRIATTAEALATVIDAWPTLDAARRAAIAAIVSAPRG